MVIILLCKEAPLTEYEKLRARNMMRNNHRLQSMGLAAFGSFLRMRSEGDEVSGVTNNDTASSDYNPKEDEDNDGEEVDDSVVEKPVVKVCKFFLVWDVWEYFVCLLPCFLTSDDSFLTFVLMLLSLLFICCAHTDF